MMGGAAIWRQCGQIFFWMYRESARGIPGFHMSWDEKGREDVQQMLESLASGNSGSYRTLRLSTPTAEILAAPNCGQKISTLQKPRIMPSEHGDELSVDGNYYIVSLTTASMADMKRKILDVIPGRELSLNVGQSVIYFWW